MQEVEPEQSSASSEESLSTKNARLENEVARLTREKEELLRKVAHYEEYTKRLCSVLRKLKGSIDGLAGQSALIGEALASGREVESDDHDEENAAPEQPPGQAKKKMQTASVLPMVRGFPIRRIIIPLQRLNINSHRHRPNRIHGHRREPWWREAEAEAPEPLQEALPLAHRPGHGQRVPVRRLQRAERRPHRAVVRPRARPGARRGQEAASAERGGTQNRRGGSSHQMLQAVVLLQRLSLTQHQQQQQRREQESPPAESARSPVVTLQDVSAAAQTGDRVSPKSEEPAVADGVEAESAEGSSAGPSAREETAAAGRSVDSEGPSGQTSAVPSPAPSEAGATGDSHSEGTAATASDGQETEVEPCRELPPVLTPAEQGEFTTSAEEAAGERAVEPPPPPLSPFPPCCGGRPAEAADGGIVPPSGEPPPPETSEMEAIEAVPNGEPEATAGTSESDETPVAQPEPAQLQSGDTTAQGYSEVAAPESSGAPPNASAESAGAVPPRSPSPQKEEEPPDNSLTPCGSRKRKASASADSPDRCARSPRSDGEREQSPHSESDQGCRPRRRCAIRTNYALFFAGWNADWNGK